MACGKRRRRRTRRCRSKRRRQRSKCKMGKISRNPFFNFLRCFRVRHCGWPAKKIAIQGAKAWCKMNKCQRKVFYKMARKRSKCKSGPLIIPKPCCKRQAKRRRRRSCRPKRRKRSCSKRRRRRSSCRRRKRSCSRGNTDVVLQNATE